MFYLGLLLPICFIPGVTGAAIPTQWAVLSCVLPTLWRGVQLTPLHLLLIGFLAWACLTTTWATNHGTSVLGLWYAAIWVGSFWLGSGLTSLVPLWKGLAIGLILNLPIVIAQTFGYFIVNSAELVPGWPQPAGLFVNSTLFGSLCALVLIACAAHRLWWYTVPLLFGVIASHSRGAMLIVAATLIARKVHWLAALALLVAGAIVYTTLLSPADSQRIILWSLAVHGLTFAGWGPDSFNDVFYLTPPANMVHAEFAHNDYLQLSFEYGLGAILLLGPFSSALTRTASVDWPILFAFTLLATFYFPLYTPLTAFIGCVVAGHLLRSWPEYGYLRDRWGFMLALRQHHLQSATEASRSHGIPMVAKHPQLKGRYNG